MKVPLYRFVATDLLKRIRSREFSPGQRLPGDQVLEAHYGAGRVTILRALQELTVMGEVRRVRGHGTFVGGPGDTQNAELHVVVVFPQRESFGAPELLAGIERALVGSRARIGTRDSENESAKERAVLESLLIQNPAGIILFPSIGSIHNTDLVSRVIAQRIPLVVIDRRLTFFDVPFVSCDNRSGAMEVVRHLVNQGKERIAFVGHSLDWVSSEQERFAGYCQTLAENGISVEMNLVLMTGIHQHDYPRETMSDVVARLRERKVDAVFAVNDLLAIALIRALKETGVRVPEDMAVAGFDDIDFAKLMKPALTTFRQPFFKIGMEAAQLIMADRASEGAGRQALDWGSQDIRVPGTLVVRQSTQFHAPTTAGSQSS